MRKVSRVLLISISSAIAGGISIKYARSFYIQDKENKHVLITGCDSGFGKKFAMQLDSKGIPVIATCYTEKGAEELKALSSKKMQIEILDVSNPEQVDQLKLKLEKQLSDKGLHALVNNAGISTSTIIGQPHLYNFNDFISVYAINSAGSANMCLRFLPLLKKAQGRIVNCSSAAGRISEGHNLPYSMSKFAVESLSDGLRLYLRKHGNKVSVHIIEPGFYNTEIIDEIRIQQYVEKGLDRMDNSDMTEEQFRKYKETYKKNSLARIKRLKEEASNDTGDVTDAYEHAVFSKWPKRRYIIGNDCRYFIAPLSLLPAFFADWVLTEFKD